MATKRSARGQIRQGDILLVPVRAIPTTAKRVKSGARGVVLAEGEASGHAHVLPPDRAEMWTAEGQTFVKVTKIAKLAHEEHKPLSVTPGMYRVIQQRQYEPASIGEAAAKYEPRALGEVFWLAFQAISDDDKRFFFGRVLDDPNWLEDLADAIAIVEARGDPTRPFEEFEEELRSEGLL